MGNEQSLERFGYVIDSIGLDMLDSVVVVSQSSPEGAYEHNLKLSQNRSATMRRVIEERYPELASRLTVNPDGESWARLREYVVNDKKMSKGSIEQVLRVIDSDINIATKKWRMQQLPVYRYLLRTYYPRLRNSIFCIVYYTKANPIEPDTIVVDKLESLPLGTIEEPTKELVDTNVVEVVMEQVAIEQRFVERKPLFNVHTNLLYDLGTVLNAGVEYYPYNSRWSVAIDYTFPWWSKDKKHHYLQLIDGELEVRRYFKKEVVHVGHYLSLYGHANYYDFSFDNERAWQGEGVGFGLGYGYVWQPWENKCWKLEAFIHLGYYQSHYDPYHASDPYNGKYYYDWEGSVENFSRRNHRLRWVGPTGLGLKLSYDLNWRKVVKTIAYPKN